MKESRISLNQIEVNTVSYRWAHGHLPKGKGNWAFAIGNKKEAEENPDKVFWVNYSLFSDAVKVAKREAQKKGVTTIYVLS